MNAEQYKLHANSYESGHSPLFQKGDVFIMPDIPKSTVIASGALYGRSKRSVVGKKYTITSVRRRIATQYRYYVEGLGWNFLECDVMLGMEKQPSLFELEVDDV